jgi:hypothetical protein
MVDMLFHEMYLQASVFTKFQPEKYDFDLYKGFFMKKNGPNLPDFEGIKIQISRFL